MQITAQEIAQIVNGTVEGNAAISIHRPSKIEEGGEGSITFLAHPKYEQYAYTTTASILLVDKDFVAAKPISATLVRVENVRVAIATLLQKFEELKPTISGISDYALIHAKAQIGKNTAIEAFTVIEDGVKVGANCALHAQVYIGKDVQIGDNVVLFPGVKIYHGCVIGSNCIVHANTVIGADGFGFAPQADGTLKKTPQIGNVILEDNVEIGSNTVIDRAIMGSTILRKGAKLDNLIQIAHNVEVGENTVIAAQAGIAGSTTIGKNNQIGGQAGFVGHIYTADGVGVQAQSGVAASIKKEKEKVYGSPALPYSNYLKSYAVFKNLPDLRTQVRELEKELKALKEEVDKNK